MPLHKAAMNGHQDLCYTLFTKHKADINAKNTKVGDMVVNIGNESCYE
jgi:ankyrin repeat protein